jgi:nucleotide-binding universal stress UspA family protein
MWVVDDKEINTMFHRMLVATGGSPWSRNAVETAVRLAADWQAEMRIVHILEDDPQYQPPGMDVSDPQLRAEMEEAGEHMLSQAAERAAAAQVVYEAVAQWGEIPEEIVRLAGEQQCDLIVMGTRHLSGEKRLMTGRICNAVIATAPCPVLVVPLLQSPAGR